MTIRSLLASIILGVAGAAFVIPLRMLNHTLMTTAPWISHPPPFPFWIFSLVAILLIRRPGAALIQSIVTFVIAWGPMGIINALIIELIFFFVWRRNTPKVSFKKPFGRNDLIWVFIASTLCGIATFGWMMILPEARQYSGDLLTYSLLIRAAVGIIAAPIAYYITLGIFKAGRDPQGLLTDSSY